MDDGTLLARMLALANPAALTMREKVNAIEEEMRKVTGPDRLDIATKHYFAPGVYAREIFIPKGALLTGQLHKYPQINIMSRGHLAVLVGERIVPLIARGPIIIASPAGTKRIAYARADTVWTTIHGTNLTDVDEIEAHFMAESDADYEAFLEQDRPKEIAQWHG